MNKSEFDKKYAELNQRRLDSMERMIEAGKRGDSVTVDFEDKECKRVIQEMAEFVKVNG